MSSEADQFRWQDAAVCQGAPSYIFFPNERNEPDFQEHEEYEGKTWRDFCLRCPVIWLCKEFAVLHDQDGVWGGQTNSARARQYKRLERFEMRNIKEESGNYTPLYGHS